MRWQMGEAERQCRRSARHGPAMIGIAERRYRHHHPDHRRPVLRLRSSVTWHPPGGDPSSQVAPGPGPAPSKADDEMRNFVSRGAGRYGGCLARPLPQAPMRSAGIPSWCSSPVPSIGGCAAPPGAAVGPQPLLSRRPQGHHLDLSFFRDLRDRFRAPGDFAGLRHRPRSGVITSSRCSVSPTACGRPASGGRAGRANALSVRLELRADCSAGVWAFSCRTRRGKSWAAGRRGRALNAASAIGDDRLQKRSRGRIARLHAR